MLPCGLAWLAKRHAVRVDAAPAEGVDALPAPGQVEDLEATHPLGQRRVNDEIVALRLETEARPQQEQWRSGRPGLRAAGCPGLDKASRRFPGGSRRTPPAAWRWTTR